MKKNLYQDRFRTHEYFWFDPTTLEFAGFRLISQSYQPISNDSGWLWSEVLELYLGVHQNQLRYFSQTGQLVLTPSEAALQAQQEAEQAQRRAEHLAAQRRSLGIEPEA